MKGLRRTAHFMSIILLIGGGGGVGCPFVGGEGTFYEGPGVFGRGDG